MSTNENKSLEWLNTAIRSVEHIANKRLLQIRQDNKNKDRMKAVVNCFIYMQFNRLTYIFSRIKDPEDRVLATNLSHDLIVDFLNNVNKLMATSEDFLVMEKSVLENLDTFHMVSSKQDYNAKVKHEDDIYQINKAVTFMIHSRARRDNPINNWQVSKRLVILFVIIWYLGFARAAPESDEIAFKAVTDALTGIGNTITNSTMTPISKVSIAASVMYHFIKMQGNTIKGKLTNVVYFPLICIVSITPIVMLNGCINMTLVLLYNHHKSINTWWIFAGIVIILIDILLIGIFCIQNICKALKNARISANNLDYDIASSISWGPIIIISFIDAIVSSIYLDISTNLRTIMISDTQQKKGIAQIQFFLTFCMCFCLALAKIILVIIYLGSNRTDNYNDGLVRLTINVVIDEYSISDVAY